MRGAVKLRNELCNCLLKGGFQLTKLTLDRLWKPRLFVTDSLKALGTSWNTKDDVLMFTNASSILTEKYTKTKRSLIILYSRVFDPMGLRTPVLMIPKLLFQKLWARGLDWDQPLDSNIENSWEKVANIDHIKVPRWLL